MPYRTRAAARSRLPLPAARPLALPNLPDDVLTHILRQVPQSERLGSVALVSRRMHSLAVSPALVGELEVTFYDDTSAWPVRALLLWLARHGRAVRDLSFCVSDDRDDSQQSDDWSDQDSDLSEPKPEPCSDLPSVCLTAACMAAPLQRLSILNVDLPTLAWLPLVAGSLEELTLTGSNVKVDVSLHELTQLTYLHLWASDYWSPDVRLPPNLLHFRCTSFKPHIDHLLAQLSSLHRLAKLNLWLHRHEGAIPLSSPLRSLTSLRWHGRGLNLGWLAQLTGLRWLELTALVPEAGPGASSLEAALGPLSQLTSLKLNDWDGSTDGLPQALQQLRALQRLRLVGVRPPPTLLPGPWLAGLHKLTLEAAALLASLPALQAAVGLQHLKVQCIEFRASLAEVADSQWQALCQWAEGHPQLSRLDLVFRLFNLYGAAPLPPALLYGLLTVQERRPGLAVYCGSSARSERVPLELHRNLDRGH